MQKKNNVSCMKQHQLTSALNDCLPKILQILEVTLTKLVLRMDAVASERSEEKFRDIQNQTNNNTINANSSGKKQKFDLTIDDKDEEENEGENVMERLTLSHAIIDLLNTIEAGAKGTVIRTTEVSMEFTT